MAPVVGPLVDAVIAGAARARELAESTAVRAFASVESSATWAENRRADRAARGAAWALLGLLRLHLLLPEGTPDPAAATRARLDRADAKLSRETAPTLACLAWQTRASGATPPPESAVESASRRREASPPSPPDWRERRAQAGSAPVDADARGGCEVQGPAGVRGARHRHRRGAVRHERRGD